MSDSAPNPTAHTSDVFRKFANAISEAAGTSWAFIAAFLMVMGWAVTGPVFQFSETWQLVINTGTTIVTFLMVFLVQNAQNRDSKAVNLKLDELIHSIQTAHNRLIDAESLSDEEIKANKDRLAIVSKIQEGGDHKSEDSSRL